MMTTSQTATSAWQGVQSSGSAEVYEGSIWAKVTTWLALFMTLFVTVGGGIKLHYAPVAFALTAMSGNSIKQLALKLAGLSVMLLLMATRSRGILRVCLNARSLLVLPILAFASVLWSQSPSQTLTQAPVLALTTLFAIYLYVRYPGDQLVSILAVAAAISLLGCLVAVVFFPSVGIDSFQQDAWRGVFSQKDNCAVISVCFLVVGLHYRARHLAGLVLRGTVIFLALLFIVMSGSRTGWLALAIAFGVTYGLRLIQRMPWRDRLLFLMILTIPVGMVILLLFSNFDTFLALIGKDPTMSQRTIIWLTVLSPIAKHPLLGYGYSAFWQGLAGESANTILVTGWAENQAQSGYLDVMLQLGLLGLVPLIWMLGRGLTQAARALNPLNTAPVQMATVLLLVLIVVNVGETGFLVPIHLLWFYTLLALLILDGSRKREETT
jgi:exopolysaccharide production protein ExoQ